VSAHIGPVRVPTHFHSPWDCEPVSAKRRWMLFYCDEHRAQTEWKFLDMRFECSRPMCCECGSFMYWVPNGGDSVPERTEEVSQ
jgi:hypothetical protein